MFKKKSDKKQKLPGKGLISAAKVMSPLLIGLYYFLILAAVLAGIIALIMVFVNTDVDKMMLPPYMSKTDTGYTISIGSGIRIDALHDAVTLGDIKTVIYAEIMLFVACCFIVAPLSFFLAKLMKNVGDGNVHEPKNSRYMMYVGLTVAVGYTFVDVARNFYNWLLVKTFVPYPETVHLSLRPELGGILVGVIIMVLAAMFANVCAKIPRESSSENLPIEAKKDR